MLHQNRIQPFVMAPCAAFLPKGWESGAIIGRSAALRRVPAKFRGLLRRGRNRKKALSDQFALASGHK
jgi:hypothetical protein